MRHRLFFVVLVLFSCGIGSGAPPATSPAAPTKTPAPTATPAPLSTDDLEPLLVQSGDLPAGMSGAQVKDKIPVMFKDCPVPDLAIDQRFQSKAANAGGVVVMIYKDPQQRETTYKLVAKGMIPSTTLQNGSMNRRDLSDVGEKGIGVSIEMSLLGRTFSFSEVLFAECRAVVHIRLADVTDIDDAVAYAKRLDKRLKPVVCP